MTGFETPYRLEIGSEVIVDGNPVAPNATQVADNPSGAGLVGKTKSATAARPVDAKGSVR
jgi:hypothetical protein